MISQQNTDNQPISMQSTTTNSTRPSHLSPQFADK
ncbi:hypothetical protein EVA_12170 [gut metagenome]|uniref:Uncharacterized protein n=1 Tax=gut metagenome TaxID=749906 RepID=J9GD78_9ZZZZ